MKLYFVVVGVHDIDSFSFCLSACFSVCLFVCLCMSVYLSVSVSLSVSPPSLFPYSLSPLPPPLYLPTPLSLVAFFVP